MKRRTIVYCDDQERFRQQFIDRHKNHYDIITVDDTRELLPTLERLKVLPDLVLLDLYHPREDDAGYAEKAAQAEISLAELDAQIEKTTQAVTNAWEPRGIDVLKLIRQKYSAHKLSVVMFTQKGLLMIGDDKMQEAELNGADWLIKKKLSARTEEIAIDRLIMRTPEHISESTEKRYRWVLAFSWLIIGLLVCRMIFSTDQFSDILIAFAGALVTGLASYLISPLISNMNKNE